MIERENVTVYLNNDKLYACHVVINDCECRTYGMDGLIEVIRFNYMEEQEGEIHLFNNESNKQNNTFEVEIKFENILYQYIVRETNRKKALSRILEDLFEREITFLKQDPTQEKITIKIHNVFDLDRDEK